MILPAFVLSYLIGSIPTAYIFARALKGVDIRTFGSGNVGATNAMRLLGKRAGITVLVLDVLKGFAAVTVVGGWACASPGRIEPETLRLLLGLTCILGHSYTVFLRFRGGKGVAASLGVLAGLAFGSASLRVVLMAVLAVWVIVFLFSRLVSLSSIIAACAFPVSAVILRQPRSLIVASIALCIFVVVRHKSNIQRLFKGTEKRL